MDNFQYSVQLSEQDWAEFSATTDECGLLQADLASGDELLSSDIDQGDSSGSSPPGPPPLLTGQLASRGRGSWGRKEDTAAQQLASRPQCEPVLAPGARQQEAGKSTEPETLPSPSLGAAPVSQCSFLPDSAASRGEMQRLLQGPASSPAGDASGSPDSPGCGGPSQKLPDSPGVSRRSPGRKKRRGVGAKGGQRAGVPGPSAAQSLTREARPEEALVAGTAKLTAQALKDKPDPADSAGALEPGSRPSEEVARQGLCLDLSRPVPTTEQGTDQITPAPRAELHTVSTSVQEICPDVSKAKPDVALSTPVFKPQPDTALSTPATKLQPDMASVSTCKPPPDTILSSPTCKLQPNLALCIPACKPDVTFSTPATNPQLDNASSTPANKPQPNNGLSTSASEADISISTPASTPQCDRAMSVSASPHRLHGDSPVAGPGVKPEGDLITPDSVAELQDVLPYSSAKAVSEVGVSIPAAPSSIPVSWTEPAPADTEVSVLQGGSQEKPGREPLAGAPGHSTGEGPQGPAQATKKKKVRFSMALPSPEEPGLGEATGSPSSATPHSRAPQTRGRSSTWDAVAVGPRAPQPRILKHLPPPPATASSVGPEPGSRFEVTLPEAYEFFFCDTIEEEDEAVEDEAVDSQALDEIQWPDTCEFFFRDFRAQRSRRQGHSAPRAPPRAEQEAARPPGDLVPISIPEAYEHLFGEDRLEDTSATLLQLRTSEPLKEGALGLPPEPDPATAEQFSLAVRQADELRGPFTSFTFSQNDMCLVFVAFATWAVRTSDLHTPDAWKTVLLANIGTISAIRYFRQQVRRGRSPSRNSSPSGSPSSSASC